MAELTTRRLLIREVWTSDTDDFFRYRQEEHYWRHIPVEPPAPRRDSGKGERLDCEPSPSAPNRV
jgi:hypothetical protein